VRQGRAAACESGSAVVEFVWITLILLVPFTTLLVVGFDLQRAAFGVSAASRSGARAFVQAPDESTAHARAHAAVRIALADQGLEPTRVAITCRPADACLQPGSSVRVRVHVRASVAAVAVDSTHVERFGAYREGR
jgi:hypothetical protein